MNSQQFTFDAADSNKNADVFVTDMFQNSFGDTRAVLGGKTYEAKEAIKFNWHVSHHAFDKDRSGEWTVDGDDESLDALEAALADAGFTFAASHRAPQNDEFDAFLAAADEAHTHAIAADDEVSITVEYMKKSGKGTATKTGKVTTVRGDNYHTPTVKFARDGDNHLMFVHVEDDGRAALFTVGSYAPFVGNVVSITLEAPEAETVEADADTDAVEEAVTEAVAVAVADAVTPEADAVEADTDASADSDTVEAVTDGGVETAKPGDTVEVKTDSRTYAGTVVGSGKQYSRSTRVTGRDISAMEISFVRADGHRMHLCVYDDDVADLYTHRANKHHTNSNGHRAIVAEDVSYTLTAEDIGYTDPGDIDLADFEAGDTAAFKTATGDEYEFDVVEVVVDPNGNGARYVNFGERNHLGEYRHVPRLASWGEGSVSYLEGDIAEPGFDYYPVVGVRVTDTDEADAFLAE